MPNDLLLFFVGSFVSLFSIVDPLVAVPVFASLTQKYTLKQKTETAKRASMYVFWILIAFFIAGGLILKFFGISLVILIVICVVTLLCYVFLILAHAIAHKMGTTMMKSFTRIMGFILLCIGVQYIVNGVMPLLKTAFHG